MLEFKTMRQRVEFAYEQLNIDIFYEGDYLYTLENNNNKEVIERITEKELDKELNRMWNMSQLK